MNFNKVMLAGKLTRDPEVRHTNGTTAVASFGLAINRKYKTQAGEQREEVTFLDCEAWGRTAEVIAQHLSKGKPIFIEGRLKLDEWEDKGGGGKRSKVKVVVENFQFVGGKNDDAPGGGYSRGKKQTVPPSGGYMDHDDIPF